MFCLVARHQAEPKNLDELVRIFREQYIPLASRQAGFKSAYFMNKPTGQFMIVSIWNSEADANVWIENPGHHEIGAQASLLTNGAPERDSYDVQGFKIV